MDEKSEAKMLAAWRKWVKFMEMDQVTATLQAKAGFCAGYATGKCDGYQMAIEQLKQLQEDQAASLRRSRSHIEPRNL